MRAICLVIGSALVLGALVLSLADRSPGEHQYNSLSAMAVDFDRIYTGLGCASFVFAECVLAVKGDHAELYYREAGGPWERLRTARNMYVYGIENVRFNYDGTHVGGSFELEGHGKQWIGYRLSDNDLWKGEDWVRSLPLGADDGCSSPLSFSWLRYSYPIRSGVVNRCERRGSGYGAF